MTDLLVHDEQDSKGKGIWEEIVWKGKMKDSCLVDERRGREKESPLGSEVAHKIDTFSVLFRVL